MPHLLYTLLTAALLSAALALNGRRTSRERLNVALYSLFSCAAATLAGSWLMHWIHG